MRLLFIRSWKTLIRKKNLPLDLRKLKERGVPQALRKMCQKDIEFRTTRPRVEGVAPHRAIHLPAARPTLMLPYMPAPDDIEPSVGGKVDQKVQKVRFAVAVPGVVEVAVSVAVGVKVTVEVAAGVEVQTGLDDTGERAMTLAIETGMIKATGHHIIDLRDATTTQLLNQEEDHAPDHVPVHVIVPQKKDHRVTMILDATK